MNPTVYIQTLTSVKTLNPTVCLLHHFVAGFLSDAELCYKCTPLQVSKNIYKTFWLIFRGQLLEPVALCFMMTKSLNAGEKKEAKCCLCPQLRVTAEVSNDKQKASFKIMFAIWNRVSSKCPAHP